MKVLVDDFVRRGYFGVILTGGEPTAPPRAARASPVRRAARPPRPHDHQRLAARRPRVRARPRRRRPEASSTSRSTRAPRRRGPPARPGGHAPGRLRRDRQRPACGVEVNVNCVINKLNADHLDENIRHFIEHHPYVRHFVWNNLDPSMGRAEVNQDQFTPRLADFELSLHRAMRLLHRVRPHLPRREGAAVLPGEFAWASTETRKIVKGEERIVHFLDAKQTVRQTDWAHLYADRCDVCSLRTICGGLFDRGDGYDPAELAPQFVDPEPVVRAVLDDPRDPSRTRDPRDPSAAKRRSEARLAEAQNIAQEHADAPPDPPPRDAP
jgi:hypothetical protein